MYRENNSLEKYLENEIERLKKDIENKKNRHYVNQKIVEECRERIRTYRDKEDSIFNLLSPVSVESSYKEQIESENKIIEQTNEENMTLISEIAECNEKINEIRKQLQAQSEAYSAVGTAVYDDREVSDTDSAAEDENFRQEWMDFINRILNDLKQAEDVFYTNPAACKELIGKLREYVINKCYGE